MTSTPVVEQPLPVSALGVQRRVPLKGDDQIMFSFALDSTADKEAYFQLMDLITAVSDRERWKEELREKFKALDVAKAQPAQMLKEIERIRVDRAAYIAAREATHERRTPFKLTEKNKEDLKKFDQQIAMAEMSAKNFARDIPIVEWEIACLEAKIAGREPPEPPSEVADAIEDLKVAA